MSVFVQMISSKPCNILLLNLVIAGVHAKRLVYYFQGQGLSKGSHNQNMTVPTTACCTADPSATKLGFMIHYHETECLMENWNCCVQGQGYSKFQYVNECLSRLYLLNG